MIGLVAVYVLIGLNVVAAAIIGRHQHGSFRAWWKN